MKTPSGDRKNPTYGELVGNNVRSLRKAKGLTQLALAAATSLSRATIAALEGGKYESVELKTIGALARVLGVSEEMLIRPASPVEGPEVSEFRASPWFHAIKPTPSEMRWLAQIAGLFWADGLMASPKAMVDLIDLRRRHSRD